MEYIDVSYGCQSRLSLAGNKQAACDPAEKVTFMIQTEIFWSLHMKSTFHEKYNF